MKKMQLNDEQYEKAARWLDAGEADRGGLAGRVEGEVAEEIVRDEARLARVLDVGAPPAALAQARARMLAELAKPWWRTRWVGRAAAIAAVAAIVAVAMVRIPPARVNEQPATADISAETMGRTMAEAAESDVMGLLADELTNIEATSLVAVDDATLEMRIDAVGNDLLEGTLIDDTTTWLLDDEQGLSS